ncbi:hypothetical protein BST61_g11492 [Cercospora zeina]
MLEEHADLHVNRKNLNVDDLGFARKIAEKFTNYCVSDEDLIEISGRPDATEIYYMDPAKLWVVGGKHPGYHLMQKWNPESESLEGLHKFMIERANGYLTTMAGAVLVDHPVEASAAHMHLNEQCCDSSHRINMIRAPQLTCRITTPAKSWQRSDGEDEKISQNMNVIENKAPCQIVEKVWDMNGEKTALI